MPTLIITADDYGYCPRYDEGIVAAARAGAIDAVSCFASGGDAGPERLLETGVEIGLHLDLGAPFDAPRADAADRARAEREIGEQLEAFERTFGRPPAYLDGHHHGHAREGIAALACEIALARKLPMRSISPRHRRLLRCRGVPTPDRLIGRLSENEPVLPAELAAGETGRLPEGAVLEWVVHPGRRDPSSGSSYDAGREQDLELLLGWQPPAGIRRATHAGAGLVAPPWPSRPGPNPR